MAVRKKYDRNVLGRGLDNIGSGRGLGLDALIDTSDIETKGTSNLNEIPLAQIEPNPNQPRHEFDEVSLRELANSIREIGIVTPITVRQTENGNYQIIAGERRWRAAQMAGLDAIPAYVKVAGDEYVMEMALAENIQREDLNAIEIALAYQRLAEDTGLTQEKISERMGKSRTQRNAYSVRKVEELVQAIKRGDSLQEAKKKVRPQQLPLEFSILRDRLSELFKVKVQMVYSKEGKGRITIPFQNEEELETLLTIIDKMKNV